MERANTVIPVKTLTTDEREQGSYDAASITLDAIRDGILMESVVKTLWETCTDSLIASGYFEREGAKFVEKNVAAFIEEVGPLPGQKETLN